MGKDYNLVRDLYCDSERFSAMAERTSVYTLGVTDREQLRQLARVLAFPAAKMRTYMESHTRTMNLFSVFVLPHMILKCSVDLGNKA